MSIDAEKLAWELAEKYRLTYRTQVNLEGTINGMLESKLTIDQAHEFITDILDNLETIGRCYNKNHNGLDKVVAGQVIHDPRLGQDAAFLAKWIRDLENQIEELKKQLRK